MAHLKNIRGSGGHMFRIPGARKNEHVEFVLRRHWFIPVSGAVFFFLLAVLPFLFRGLFSDQIFAFIQGTGWESVVIMLLVVYYLLIWLFFATFLVDYYLDTWIVTNERIIDIEQVGLFKRVVSQHYLVRVQDVTSKVRGIIHTFLNFGDVFIQTAGGRGRFRFKQVPNPNKVKQRVIELQRRSIKRLTLRQREQLSLSGTPYDIRPDP